MSYNEADKIHHVLNAKENVKLPWTKGNECCSVMYFEKYTSKRNPYCDRFFQRPSNNMKISNSFKEASLSTKYTKHCIRTMVSSNLSQSWVFQQFYHICHRVQKSLKSLLYKTNLPRKKTIKFTSFLWKFKGYCGIYFIEDIFKSVTAWFIEFHIVLF